MTTGSCFCGAVEFEVAGPLSRLEVCHCSRCARAYGVGLAATRYARASDFRWTRGAPLVRVYEAPVREHAPGYQHVFCVRCGGPLPITAGGFGLVEVPVGALDGDAPREPAYEMFAPRRAGWTRRLGACPAYQGGAPLQAKVVKDLGRAGADEPIT